MIETAVEDITTEEGDELYLVRAEEPNGAAVMWLHWFDEAPNANRTQFLDEARVLADRGLTSVLPQLHFPWESPPTGISDDLARIGEETAFLHAVYQTLAQSEGVDSTRIALVGHDFGAMHGMTLFGEVDLAAAVLIAATTRWSDWFLRFWPIESDRYDYMRALEIDDPVTTVRRADCPLLFQFGRSDFYIAPMTGLELFQAAPEPKQLLDYESGHEMEGVVIGEDRARFLTEQLDINA